MKIELTRGLKTGLKEGFAFHKVHENGDVDTVKMVLNGDSSKLKVELLGNVKGYSVKEIRVKNKEIVFGTENFKVLSNGHYDIFMELEDKGVSRGLNKEHKALLNVKSVELRKSVKKINKFVKSESMKVHRENRKLAQENEQLRKQIVSVRADRNADRLKAENVRLQNEMASLKRIISNLRG